MLRMASVNIQTECTWLDIMSRAVMIPFPRTNVWKGPMWGAWARRQLCGKLCSSPSDAEAPKGTLSCCGIWSCSHCLRAGGPTAMQLVGFCRVTGRWQRQNLGWWHQLANCEDVCMQKIYNSMEKGFFQRTKWSSGQITGQLFKPENAEKCSHFLWGGKVVTYFYRVP